jgi:hypothetical protein
VGEATEAAEKVNMEKLQNSTSKIQGKFKIQTSTGGVRTEFLEVWWNLKYS